MEPLLTVHDLRILLRVDDSTIRRWMRSGALPAPMRVGQVLRWKRAEIEAWLEQRRLTIPGESWRVA